MYQHMTWMPEIRVFLVVFRASVFKLITSLKTHGTQIAVLYLKCTELPVESRLTYKLLSGTI